MRIIVPLMLCYSSISNAFCFDEAALYYNVNSNLLKAIARVESDFDSKAMNYDNSNETYDIGLMQINSIHLPTLKKFKITESVLINDPCVNVYVGAWILSDNFARYGFNDFALGAYNAGGSAKKQQARERYANKVKKHLTQE
ncbi:lytic transglycosylase domain-containing protein [Vibrio lentus]